MRFERIGIKNLTVSFMYTVALLLTRRTDEDKRKNNACHGDDASCPLFKSLISSWHQLFAITLKV